MNHNFVQTYVSVDCVIFGFEDDKFNILLVHGNVDSVNNLKLPGSLIYDDEDVDEAAQRVLFELTGIKKIVLKQFRCFASPNRVQNEKDAEWLSEKYQPNITRLITVAYLSLCKVDRRLNNISKYKDTKWYPADDVPSLPFDHNLIIEEALSEIRRWIEQDNSIVFELLPRKFTIGQLHKLYEAIYCKELDIRNFHKKIAGLPYIQSLDEKQQGVPHRAARYYKFDKKAFNKQKAGI